MKFTFSLFVAVVSLGRAIASNVIELDADNFDSVIGQGKPALVELSVSIFSGSGTPCLG